jgi:hypothetical protein
LVATATQAQYLGTGSNPNSHPVQGPYTAIGPAGAGAYVEPHQQIDPNGTQRENYGATRQREPVHRHRRHAKRDALKKGAGPLDPAPRREPAG